MPNKFLQWAGLTAPLFEGLRKIKLFLSVSAFAICARPLKMTMAWRFAPRHRAADYRSPMNLLLSITKCIKSVQL
ncbi:uncharacterized protein Dvar_04480 [Desulfosarcina variabilis str. Montpellier]